MDIEKQKKISFIPFYQLVILFNLRKLYIEYSLGFSAAFKCFLKVYASMLLIVIPSWCIRSLVPTIFENALVSYIFNGLLLYWIAFVGLRVCINEQKNILNKHHQ